MSSLLRNKILTGIVILLLIANITTIVLFWLGMKNNHPHPPQPASEFLIKELGFNDSQRTQYESLIKIHQSQTRALREEMKIAKDSFFGLLSSKETNDSIKNRIAANIASVNSQLDDITFDHFKEVRKICDASQQQKFDAVIKDVIRMMAGPAHGPGGRPHDDRPPPPGDE